MSKNQRLVSDGSTDLLQQLDSPTNGKRIIQRTMPTQQNHRISLDLDLDLFDITDEITLSNKSYVDAVFLLNPQNSHHHAKMQQVTRMY